MKFGFKLPMLAGLTIFSACTKTKFGSGSGQPPVNTAPPGISATTTVPNEEDQSRRTAAFSPTPNLPVCTEGQKAVRLAFVVDNSDSHSDPKNLGLGSDPVQNGETMRQRVVAEVIHELAVSEAAARQKNANFQGSDVGVAFFPKDKTIDDLDNFEYVSGKTGSVLSDKMTSLKGINPDQTFFAKLHSELNFTHTSTGNTPYATGLQAAKMLLASGKQTGDSRPDLIFFISDGFPSDSKPSLVRAKKAELGSTELVVFSVYGNGDTNEMKVSLRTAWNQVGWGKAEIETYPGSSDDEKFEGYWKVLTSFPKQIASKEISVFKYVDLKKFISEQLKEAQICK